MGCHLGPRSAWRGLHHLQQQPAPTCNSAETPGFPAAMLPSPWLRWEAVPGADNGKSGCRASWHGMAWHGIQAAMPRCGVLVDCALLGPVAPQQCARCCTSLLMPQHVQRPALWSHMPATRSAASSLSMRRGSCAGGRVEAHHACVLDHRLAYLECPRAPCLVSRSQQSPDGAVRAQYRQKPAQYSRKTMRPCWRVPCLSLHMSRYRLHAIQLEVSM